MIYFYNEHETDSFKLRGRQVSSYLNLIGHESECIDHTEVKDSIVIVVKFIKPSNLKKLKQNGNKVIIDVLDLFCYRRFPHELISVSFSDGIIICSNAVRDFFHPWMPKKVITIPHHWDTTLMDHAEDTDTFAIGYLGNKMNHEFKKTKNVVPVYENFIQNAFKFKCHFSVRATGSPGANFKPATKVALAAGCGANIITTKDVATVELLGDDYPYYVDSTKESIDYMVDKARKDWLTEQSDWQKGLDIMSEVRKATSLPVCAEGYLRYIEALQ